MIMIGYLYGLVINACQRELHAYSEICNKVINRAKIDRRTEIKKVCAFEEDFYP